MKKHSHQYDVAFYVPWMTPLIASQTLRPSGGAETQVLLLSRALVRRWLSVCLIVFDVEDAGLPRAHDAIHVVVRPPYFGGHGAVGQLREALATLRAVWSVDAPVIVTRTAGFHVGLVAVAAWLSRRRFLYSSASLLDFDYRRVLVKKRDSLLYRFGVWLADEVVVQTDEQVRLCEARFRRSPSLARSVGEPAMRRSAEPEAFLWIGRVMQNKQPRAFVDLARAVPHARFWMVGVPALDEPGGVELWACVQEADRRLPNFELLPPRKRVDLMALVDRSVAVVSTSEFEGMPNTFLEAWARGVPVLALAHDPDEIIQAAGLGAFAHGSFDEFVEAAIGQWDKRLSQDSVAERCRAYILKQHAPEAVAAQWEKILRPCSTEPPAQATLARSG